MTRPEVDRVLAREALSPHEASLWHLVDAKHERDEERRRDHVARAADALTADEIYLASLVISLFEFYNAFVDINGVDQLSREGYDATGVRLSSAGYGPPPMRSD